MTVYLNPALLFPTFMSLLSRLRTLFNPSVETPVAPVEDYQRSTIKKPSQVDSIPSTFAPVVPWATETNPAPFSITPVAPSEPPPDESLMDCYRLQALSGNFIQHTTALRHQLSYTGMVSGVMPSCHAITGYRIL